MQFQIRHLMIKLLSTGWKQSAVDVVLSSAGWVALTGHEETEYMVHVSTPERRGIYLRDPPLLSNAVGLRGSRIPYTPAFKTRLIID